MNFSTFQEYLTAFNVDSLCFFEGLESQKELRDLKVMLRVSLFQKRL